MINQRWIKLKKWLETSSMACLYLSLLIRMDVKIKIIFLIASFVLQFTNFLTARFLPIACPFCKYRRMASTYRAYELAEGKKHAYCPRCGSEITYS